MAQIKNPLKDKMNDDELDLSICNYVDKDVPVKDIVSMPFLFLMDENPGLEGIMLPKWRELFQSGAQPPLTVPTKM